MSFQDLIQSLNVFWGKQGCLVGQPYGVEVGAGTGNPNTFFRVLGPEPFNVAYVEPSRRPQDGRYGQSPNRFQHYYQYQVILKPAPKFNQELFIESLIAIGLDPTKHDIRFVEDNWESTPLGAWGLGWEIWCDGMEVAQYTYFQQMAGTALEVPSLEITYGLERLAMYIQDVDHYRDLKWNDTTTYADLFERHEYWQAKHNFETSTPESLQILYSTYEKEVQNQLDRKNYWSAYDYQLKVSHLFNLLDARGMVSVSDRVSKFTTMGKSAKQISEMYLEERKALGYPLMNNVANITYTPPVYEKLYKTSSKKYQKNVAIVELGFEEIPASYLIDWSAILTHNWFKARLKENGISYRKAYLYMTPQRIVMKIVQPSKDGRVVQTYKGPTTQIAYTPEGEPTKALLAFMGKYTVDKHDIKTIKVGDKEVVVANKTLIYSLADVFQTICNQIIESAPKTRWMVWEKDLSSFIRPLRWILAYHNNKKLPLQVMNIASGKLTAYPRYEIPSVAKINTAQEYLQFIRESGIILSQKKRVARIKRECERKSEHKTGKFEDMVIKNSFLTENPHVQEIALEKRYAELPKELVTLILEKNQMYPITTGNDGTVWYHVVANHRRVHKRIAHGNQKVAKARLDDGLFYYQQDGQIKLTEYGLGLKQVGFHPRAGTYFEKKERIANQVAALYNQLHKAVPNELVEALHLIKNDKATALGKEFPSLEGVIGKAYALRDGINKNVANLLQEHYLPYEPAGELPPTEAGVILSIADKVDTLVTLSTVEKLPEGSHDPFEVRKTVYRLLTVLTGSKLIINLDTLPQDLYTFIQKRFEQLLLQEDIPQWIAAGVSRANSKDFGQKYTYAHQLMFATKDESERALILDTFKRVKNILSQVKGIDLGNVEHLTNDGIEPSEKVLMQFVSEHTEAKRNTIKPDELPKLAHILEKFFTDVMVMDKDESKKTRRIVTLQSLQGELEANFSLSFT